jgi:hypothetical protein
MPDPIPFPPRSAGAVLNAALRAAVAAASGAMRLQQMQAKAEPWRDRGYGGRSKMPIQIEQAALTAALPVLKTITTNDYMARLIAQAMATTAVDRVRKVHGSAAVDLG